MAMATRGTASFSTSKPRRTKEQKDKDNVAFKTAYSQAFPGFRFYFDAVPSATRDMMSKRIISLGGVSYFSRYVTLY